jgi:hypothetical protein
MVMDPNEENKPPDAVDIVGDDDAIVEEDDT